MNKISQLEDEMLQYHNDKFGNFEYDYRIYIASILIIMYYMSNIGLTANEKIMSIVFGLCIPTVSSIFGTYTLVFFIFFGFICSKYIHGWNKILFILLGVALGLLVNHNFISQEKYIKDMSENLRNSPPKDGLVSILMLLGGVYWRPFLGYNIAISILLALSIGFGIGHII